MLTFTKPTAGAKVAEGASVDLEVTSTETLKSVAFFANGVQVGAVIQAKPYKRKFENMLAGKYDLRAKGTKSNGTVEWATPIQIEVGTVVQPPAPQPWTMSPFDTIVLPGGASFTDDKGDKWRVAADK